MSNANFTPALGEYRELQPFRYWCQKVLPLVYDDSLSYYELLCKVVDYLNKTMEDVDTLHGDVTNLHQAYVELQGYVNNYFNNLDVQNEINNKLDEMTKNGELTEIIGMWLYGGYSLWIGDSYVEANSLGADKNKRFSTIVSKQLLTTELNYAIGGTGFSTQNNFLSQATLAYSENKNIADKVKYVFVGGGRNDAYLNPSYSFTQIREVVEPVFNFIKANFPNAKIICLPMLFDCAPLPNSYLHWKIGICSYLNVLTGVKILNLGQLFMGDSSYILSDNVHPNVSGHAMLASSIISSLNGGDYLPYYWEANNKITNLTGNLNFIQFNNLCGCVAEFTVSETLSGEIYSATETGFLGFLGTLKNIPVFNMTDKTVSFLQYKCLYNSSTHKFTLTLTTIGDLKPGKSYSINYLTFNEYALS